MRSVFNLGVGYVAVVEQESVDAALDSTRAGRLPRLGRRRGHSDARGGAALKIGVLISGNGTNLQALIDAGDIEIACVVSSRADAPGIQRAERAAIPVLATADEEETAALPGAASRSSWLCSRATCRSSRRASSRRFPRGAINVHPSLLPAFPGRTAIADALAHGVRVTGVTVHQVDAGIDTGPILLQEAVAVPYDDDALALEDRIHQVEHRLLVQAVRDIRTQGR